jgi:hypothetical protein
VELIITKEMIQGKGGRGIIHAMVLSVVEITLFKELFYFIQDVQIPVLKQETHAMRVLSIVDIQLLK